MLKVPINGRIKAVLEREFCIIETNISILYKQKVEAKTLVKSKEQPF